MGGAQDAGMLGILVRTGEMETRALVVAVVEYRFSLVM